MSTESIKKVAVILFDETTDTPQFLHLDQCRPLAAIIKDLCNAWGLSNPDDYALQFSDQNRQAFITERNRHEIRNGDVLRHTYSPAKTAQDILGKLKSTETAQQHASLKDLVSFSPDTTFAQEFISKQGIELLMSMIQAGCPPASTAYALRSFVELMEHQIVSWDTLETNFIKTVCGLVNFVKGRGDMGFPTVRAALEIIESIVMHSTGKHPVIDQEVTPVILVQHIESQNAEIQKNAIALINALFMKAEPEKRKDIAENLQSKHIRNIILERVLNGPNPVGPGMAHELYVLQSQMFNLLEERLNTVVDPNNQAASKHLNELRRVAFEGENDGQQSPQRKHNVHVAKGWVKLGFENTNNPLADFSRVPPGKLALDNIVYFARNHAESYTKVVLENSCRSDKYDCPFAKASIEMTLMLSEILKVDQQPTEEGNTYHPMFFTHDHPFEEFFCITMQLLNKTWKEMRATSVDFHKVMSVVKEQITRALQNQPSTFDKFRNKVFEITFRKITEIWEQERQQKEELEKQVRPVVELREQLMPEIKDLIRQQRLNYLVEGTRFNKYSARGTRLKEKYMYWRLSPNHKVFHYGDCEEDTVPLAEELPQTLAVVDIRSMHTGRDCPHVKEKDTRKKFSMSARAFSIQCEPTMAEKDTFNFIATEELEFDMWTDGLNALLSNPMTSNQAQADLEILLGMEVKLRLLDTEGVDIPMDPPTIPPEPNNYDFTTD